MVYSKPELYVENFIPSVAVAACEREWEKNIIQINSQTVTCGRTGSTENLFGDPSNGCSHLPTSFGYYNVSGEDAKAGDTFKDPAIVNAIKGVNNKLYEETNSEHTMGYNGDLSGYITSSRDGYTIYDGYYATWKKTSGGGSNDCFGAITAQILKCFTSSY